MKLIEIKTKRARSDMLPLMDCMFILLIYFIFAMMAMVSSTGIKVDKPSAITAIEDTKKYISIGITNSGKLFLEKKALSLNELQWELEKLNSLRIDEDIYINADSRAKSKVVLDVLNMLKRIKIYNVYFETKKVNLKVDNIDALQKNTSNLSLLE